MRGGWDGWTAVQGEVMAGQNRAFDKGKLSDLQKTTFPQTPVLLI
jgi:hypothetical protein